jgi:creatinine amidohydrolase
MSRQIETLRPGEIRAALAERSLVWLPLGTIEWHCEHLPVGLDAATSHALCLAAAEASGGLVYPPLYYGTGGDHSAYPWTVMMPTGREIEAIIQHTIRRLAELGVKCCVIFSGHFAGEQLDMIDRIAEGWNAAGLPPRIVATAVNRCPSSGMPPDHAGAFETLLTQAIAPDRVELGLLPGTLQAPDTFDRHDPAGPIWGIIGADPRTADLAEAPHLFARLVAWLTSQGELDPMA